MTRHFAHRNTLTTCGLLLAAIFPMLAIAPAQAGQPHRCAAPLCSISDHPRDPAHRMMLDLRCPVDTRHLTRFQSRWYEQGIALGRNAGFTDGYRDARHGRRYAPSIACLWGRGVFEERGYRDGYDDAYRAGWNEVRAECTPQRGPNRSDRGRIR